MKYRNIVPYILLVTNNMYGKIFLYCKRGVKLSGLYFSFALVIMSMYYSLRFVVEPKKQKCLIRDSRRIFNLNEKYVFFVWYLRLTLLENMFTVKMENFTLPVSDVLGVGVLLPGLPHNFFCLKMDKLIRVNPYTWVNM